MSITRPNRDPDHVIALHLAAIEGSDKSKSGHNKFWIAQVWEQEGIGQRNWGKLSEPIEVVFDKLKKGTKVGQQKIERKNLLFYEGEARYREDPNGTSSKYAVVKYGRPYKRISLINSADIQVLSGGNNQTKAIVSLNPAVHSFIQTITNTTRQHIQTHFKGDVAAMSMSHIKDAREIIEGAVKIMPQFKPHAKLDDAVKAYNGLATSDQKTFRNIMNDYFSAIPTVLPRDTASIVDQLAGQFMLDLRDGEIEDRLQQLETAAKIAMAQKKQPQQASQNDPVAIAYQQLGCRIEALSPSSPEYIEITRRFNQRSPHGHTASARVEGVYAVHIPSERDAFLQDDFGKFDANGEQAVLPLFHGTRLPNTQHILRTGLIIKRVADNGSRFGRGLYHSTYASRSWMYTDQSRRTPNIMFVSHVAIGTPYKDNGSNSRIDLNWVAGRGCHSVLGEGEWGRQGDEFITYKESQSTISYALVLKAA